MHFSLVFVEHWFTGKVFVAFVALEWPDLEVHFVLMGLQVRQFAVGVVARVALVQLATLIPSRCWPT